MRTGMWEKFHEAVVFELSLRKNSKAIKTKDI